jgi:4-hydroxybenzoyl-CoA thioesterase
MKFLTRIVVRFGDADPAGFVYYPVIFHYAHIAMEEFFERLLGFSYNDLLATHRMGFPTVNVQAEFLLPMHYGDVVIVEVMPANMGTSSLTLDYEFRREGDNASYAKMKVVHVAMNMDSNKSLDIPQTIKTSISRHQQNHTE